MQVMEDSGWFYRTPSDRTPQKRFDQYQKDYGESKIYSFDLGNYHNQIVSDRKDLVYITALNDIVFKAIELLEDDTKSLIDIIDQYNV